MNIPMEIDVWKGDWGIPSVDLNSLEALAFAKFSGISIQVHKKNNPFWTPSGSFPVFRHGKQCFTDITSISEYLKKKNFSPDFGLNSKQTAEVVACTAMLREQLYPALQYIWWMDEKNFNLLSRPWYARVLPLPWNFYYPRYYEKRAKIFFEALFPSLENNNFIEAEVYSAAEKCLTTLSIRLGDADFFFGSHPTSLDAVVYAYLAPLMKAPFPSNVLQNHAKACVNLLKFVNRISQRYFKQDVDDYEARERAIREKRSKFGTEENPYSTNHKVAAGALVAFVMMVYAVTSGIVGFNGNYELESGYDDEDEEEDGDNLYDSN